MGKIIRGTVGEPSKFYEEQPTLYDSIINKLLKFDSEGGSIDEDAFVDELCKMHGIKNTPRVEHRPHAPIIDEKGGVIAGQYDPEKDLIIIYDDANGPICQYAETMAHEMQHASDFKHGNVAMPENVAYAEGATAEYACKKEESAAYTKQENADTAFSNSFGAMHCERSCVDADSDDLERLRLLLLRSAGRLEEIREALGRRLSEIHSDWRDNKYDEFCTAYRSMCNPKMVEMAEEMTRFASHLNDKIHILNEYQSNRIPFK